MATLTASQLAFCRRRAIDIYNEIVGGPHTANKNDLNAAFQGLEDGLKAEGQTISPGTKHVDVFLAGETTDPTSTGSQPWSNQQLAIILMAVAEMKARGVS